MGERPTYKPDYEFLLVSDEGCLLCVIHQSADVTHFRDADTGKHGEINTLLLDFKLSNGWWRFDNEEFNEARGLADAKQMDRANAKYFIVTDTGNVLAVILSDDLGIQYLSLITQKSGALSHADVKHGIDSLGWEIINDFIEAQTAAAANEESLFDQGGGWV